MEEIRPAILSCLNQFISDKKDYDSREWWQRETLMLARLCCLGGADKQNRLNELCEGIEPEFCMYSSLPALEILLGYGELLTEKSKGKLEELFHIGVEYYQKEITKNKVNSFRMISIAAIIGWGVYTEDEKLIEKGAGDLEALRQQCLLWDAPDEYVSPFYSALQLAAMAIIQECLPDTEAGNTAAALENFIWRSLLSRCHPGLGQLAGPFSRGYLSETCGHPQAVLGALEAVLGEDSPYSMAEMLWNEENCLRILPHGSLDCMRVHALYFATVSYHCDTGLIRGFKQRSYPCRFTFKTHTDGAYDISIKKEADFTRDFDYPEGETTIQVRMEKNLVLGWADRGYENASACNNFCLMYEKGNHTRTCFALVAADDKHIGEWNTFKGLGIRLAECNFPDEGVKQVTETEDGLLICCKPRRFCKGADSIKMFLAFPEHFGRLDEVLIGDCVLDEHLEDSFYSVDKIEVRDGEFVFCFIPQDKEGQLKVVRKNQYLCVEWHKDMAELETMEWKLLFQVEDGVG